MSEPLGPVHDPRAEPEQVTVGFADRFFPAQEYTQRLAAVRARMDEDGLDALLVVSPENVYYLIGLSHQGYFAFTLLIVPREGAPLLVARSMERVTLAEQAPNVEHVGFTDEESPAEAVSRVLQRRGFAGLRVGVERTTMYLPVDIWEQVRRSVDAEWVAASDLVLDLRAVKSPLEIQCVREAAALSDRAIRAGMRTAGVGVNEREIAADVYRSLVLGGSEYPGFAPLVRSAELLSHEHATWRDRVLVPGDCLFMELSASVRRYHAPLSRFVYLGAMPPDIERSADLVLEGLEEARAALRPGVRTGEVYARWQQVMDRALGNGVHQRHHCGYMVGIGFPPSWVGGPHLTGLRPGGDMELREGMVFHVMSWLLGQDLPDYGVSDTMLVTADGGEVLTSTARRPMLVA
jgi:Xaa-Pro dipeptidase